MSRAWDAIVVGLGAMGAATVDALARRGRRVLGLDRYRPPHLFGSSHGESRIIREAYFEHPMYVPFVQSAYRAWDELAERRDARLRLATGGLMIGPPDGLLVAGALASARRHGLEHEVLDAGELRRRFPLLRAEAPAVAVWEPRTGVLFPEACVEALLGSARAAGAALRFEEPVIDWRTDGDGYRVVTVDGEEAAAQVVFCCGPWLTEVVADAALPLTVERVVQHWFRPVAGASPPPGPGALPVFIWEYADSLLWYGFPDLGSGVKIALHYQGEPTRADRVRREVDASEVTGVRRLMARWLPAANGGHLGSEVCMYTNTPDLHFLIDRHPGQAGVWLVSPCSGHGFKFAPTVGEIVAAQLAGEEAPYDLEPFRLSRFAGHAADDAAG